VPVEDAEHRLVGLVTYGRLLATLTERDSNGASEDSEKEPLPIADVMLRDVVTIAPGASMAEASERMTSHRIGCLPVVEDGLLVGIVSEDDIATALEPVSPNPDRAPA
jgi:CBS domain-containing protein